MADSIGQLKKNVFSNKVRLLRFCFSGTGTYGMGLLFLLMFIPVYKKKVYIDGIHKFIIYFVRCLVNQFLTCLGSRNCAWSILGEESAARNVPEGVDPQPSHVLYVTLLGNMFGADCLSVYLLSL